METQHWTGMCPVNFSTDDVGQPDLPERITMAVGRLSLIGSRMHSVNDSEASKDAAVIDEAILLLSAVQKVVSWEPSGSFPGPRSVSLELREMADIGPRPPAVVTLLHRAADALLGKEAKLAAVDLIELEREAWGLSQKAAALARRLAGRAD